MMHILQHAGLLFPVIILSITVLCLMLCTLFLRNHLVVSIMTIIGLQLSLLSFYFMYPNYDIKIFTNLIRVDVFSIFCSFLILLSALVSSILAYTWLKNISNYREEFYMLILISAIGGVLLVFSDHLIMIFLSIELLSMPLYCLIGYSYRTQYYSLKVIIKYILLSVLSSSFLLFGISFIYACFGTLSIIGISSYVNGIVISQKLLMIGLSLILSSFCFKLSLVPFHSWTPDVYEVSSAAIVLFLSNVSKIAVFSIIIRLFTLLSFLNCDKVRMIVMFVACCSMLFGSILALRQSNIKRILGYSSIAHISYMLIGLLSHNYDYKLTLDVIYISLINYLLCNLGILGVISLFCSFSLSKNSDELFLYKGLFWKHPFLTLVFTVIVLSLAGIPLTSGFISKFFIIILGIYNQFWWFVGSVVLSSVLGIVYYLRIIMVLYTFVSCNKKLINYNSTLRYWIFTPSGFIILFSFILILLLGTYPQLFIKNLRHLQLLFC